MDNQEKLNAKIRLHAELEQELELNKTQARHYLNIDAFDFLLDCSERLIKIENEIYETSLEIKNLREKIDDEIKDVL